MAQGFAKAAQYFRGLHARIIAEVSKAEEETIKDALFISRAYSRGRYSTEQLRKMGHPYAVRRPAPPANPAIINLQTGELLQEWLTISPRIVSGEIVTTLKNNAPYAKYMWGTKRMISRPIIDTISAKLAPIRLKRLQRALDKALEVK